MTTTMLTRSKCPNCDEEYSYQEVTSCTVYGNSMDGFLKSLFDAYWKECSCGLKFDMSEHQMKTDKVVVNTPLEFDAERLKKFIEEAYKK
jgi:hypothetical protein